MEVVHCYQVMHAPHANVTDNTNNNIMLILLVIMIIMIMIIIRLSLLLSIINRRDCHIIVTPAKGCNVLIHFS